MFLGKNVQLFQLQNYVGNKIQIAIRLVAEYLGLATSDATISNGGENLEKLFTLLLPSRELIFPYRKVFRLSSAGRYAGT